MKLAIIILFGLIGAHAGPEPQPHTLFPSISKIESVLVGVIEDSQTTVSQRAAATSQGGSTCDARRQPGTDIGAKVNACDRILGQKPGEILLTGGGTISTQILLSPGHTLKLMGRGVYPSRVEGPSVVLDNNSALVCESWDSILRGRNGARSKPGRRIWRAHGPVGIHDCAESIRDYRSCDQE